MSYESDQLTQIRAIVIENGIEGTPDIIAMVKDMVAEKEETIQQLSHLVGEGTKNKIRFKQLCELCVELPMHAVEIRKIRSFLIAEGKIKRGPV